MRRLALFFGLAVLSVAGACVPDDVTPTDPSLGAAGRIRLGLVIADGYRVDKVTYVIEAGGYSQSDALPVSSDGLSELIAGVPIVKAAKVTLVSKNSLGGWCRGQAAVDVHPTMTTTVFIEMDCRPPDGWSARAGAVNVSTKFNVCPRITEATPGTIEDGPPGLAVLLMGYRDLDGDPVTVHWESEAGDFVEGNLPVLSGQYAADLLAGLASQFTGEHTTQDSLVLPDRTAAIYYECPAGEDQIVTVRADDGHGCSDTREITVPCEFPYTGITCGDGVPLEGEECDDGSLTSRGVVKD